MSVCQDSKLPKDATDTATASWLDGPDVPTHFLPVWAHPVCARAPSSLIMRAEDHRIDHIAQAARHWAGGSQGAKLRHWLHGDGFAVLTAKGRKEEYLVSFRIGRSGWYAALPQAGEWWAFLNCPVCAVRLCSVSLSVSL